MDDNQPGAVIPQEGYTESAIPEQTVAARAKNPSVARSLTRLVIGGILTGADVLVNRIQIWEELAADQSKMESIRKQSQVISGSPSSPELEDSSPTPNYLVINADIEADRQETSTDLLRLALVGMVFETQDRVVRGMRTVGRFTREVTRMSTPILRPMWNSRLISPAKNRFNNLVDRGELEIQRWIETGRQEEIHSRELTEVALYDTVDSGIDYFAESPEVVDLVASQSISFAEEVVEEVRERTVSADNLLEGFVRLIFRRPRRAELPPPPPEIQREAQLSKRQAGS